MNIEFIVRIIWFPFLLGSLYLIAYIIELLNSRCMISDTYKGFSYFIISSKISNSWYFLIYGRGLIRLKRYENMSDFERGYLSEIDKLY